MHLLNKKVLKLAIVSIASLGVLSISNVAKATKNGVSTDNSVVTIATKKSVPGTKSPDFLYGRGLTIQHSDDPAFNGRLLATSENYVTGTPSFKIFESTNHGGSWNKVGEVKDLNTGVGNRYQPFLYELPEKIGDMPAGTLLCVGNAIPGDLSTTSIVLYKSVDHGRNWSYMSTLANGGEAVTTTTKDGPVWEPFLKVINHKLVCWYSDETDKPAHSQKLVHKVSNDGYNWGNVVDDVDFKDPVARPGMVTVAQMPNSKYIMTYEVVNSGEWRTNYKISNDGLNWNANDEGQRLAYGGSPYVTVLPDGTIVANTAGQRDLYINKDNGAANKWQDVKNINMDDAYSRSLTALPNNQILIVSGGRLKAPDSTEDNNLTSMVYDLPANYHRATIVFRNQPKELETNKTAKFNIAMSDRSEADFDVTTDDSNVKVAKNTDGSYQLITNNVGNQKVVTVTAKKKGDNSFHSSFRVILKGTTAATPTTPSGSSNGQVVVSSSSNASSSSNVPETTSNSQTVNSSSSQAATDEPSPNVSKRHNQSFQVYAKRTIHVYKDADFKKVIKTYPKQVRTKAPTFRVISIAYSSNGKLRYKTTKGYITANVKYVAKLYYQAMPKQVQVLAPKGIYEYSKAKFSSQNRVKHLKRGVTLKVKKLLKLKSTSKL